MSNKEAVSLTSLKTTSSDLRAVGSRALRSAGDDAQTNIRRLLAFIEDSPVLTARLGSAERPGGVALESLRQAAQGSSKLDLPITEDAELGFLQQLLEELAEWDGGELWRPTFGYGGKRNMRDGLEELLHDAVQPYLSILNRDLETRILAIGESSMNDRSVAVHVSGGQSQINIAQSGSRIVAKQEVRAEVSSVLEAVEDLRSAIEAAPDEGVEHEELLALRELADGVREEVTRDEPRKQFLQMLHERLIKISGSIVAASTIAEKAEVLIAAVKDLLN